MMLPARFIRISRTRIPVMLFAVLIAAGASGCSRVKETARTVGDSSRKVTEAFTPGTSQARSTTALIGIESKPGAGPAGFGARFTEAMAGYLQQECRETRVDPAVGEALKSPPRLASGQVDGYSLAVLGRPRGVNFFVIGSLSDVRLQDEKTGFWLWKDTRFLIRAAARIEIIDSGSGSKVLDLPLQDELAVDELQYQQFEKAGTVSLAEVEPMLARMLREAGYQTCQALRARPWQGFIVAADRDRITLSAGSASGLSEGRMVEVFSPGGIIESKDGRRFQRPGEKIGEARISSASAEQSEALLSAPADVGAGGTVRLK